MFLADTYVFGLSLVTCACACRFRCYPLFVKIEQQAVFLLPNVFGCFPFAKRFFVQKTKCRCALRWHRPGLGRGRA